MTSTFAKSVAPIKAPGLAPLAADQLTCLACISTSRADAGIYEPLIAALSKAERFRIECLIGGTHLCESFGRTMRQFPSLPRVRCSPVDHFVAGDAPRQVADTAGRAIMAFSTALAAARPELVFVLGDRTEMLAAATAAMIHRIPIAHLHGGDITEGAYDDQCRHAITKLAHVHFPALPEHAARIAAMGEESWRIHPVGAPALDGLRRFTPIPVEVLTNQVGLDFSRPTAVVLFHPETLALTTPEAQVGELVAALMPLDMNLLIIDPNADVGRQVIADAWQRLAAARRGAVVAPSLTRDQFWSCLSHAALMIGNSSAGLIEAPSFKLPVVNIGDRQAGRVRAANVIDTPTEREAIELAIRRAMDATFRASLAEAGNPYGDGHASRRIIEVIDALPGREVLLKKKWAG